MIYVFDHDLKGAKTQKIQESALHSVCTSSIPNCNTDGLVATLFQKKPECSRGTTEAGRKDMRGLYVGPTLARLSFTSNCK